MLVEKIRIQVRLFAVLRERAGVSERTLSVPSGSCIADAWKLMEIAEPLPDNVLVARNMEYASLDTPVQEGDEIAFFPTRDRRLRVTVELVENSFNPWSYLARYQPADEALVEGHFGATAVFVGSMRDFNDGSLVQSMFLECYPGMAARYLDKLCAVAVERWQLLDALIVHRVGELLPGEPIVLVAVWSAHRSEAFEASRYLMERLKSRAPFWKKEQLDGGSRWLERNTPG